ncbi:MAG TPA: arylesterase [Balneola sp.]|nr:arylesterase [Bacteroidota bacterium]MAC06128.1 arylesterase [Balneola sp.]MAO78484.1 arylesterase [Balneola sp.]MBF64849.1 arylesterase [Balneola sp.]HAH49872.1 arylesterase [Balneola sp.]
MKKRHSFFIIFSLIMSMNVYSQEKKSILFFGDSISAGYGLEPQQAFPAIIQHKIDSLGLNYEVINGGLSGETSAGGLRRINWVLQRDIDIMILELGGNDGLRGIDLSSTKGNLQQIIDRAKAKNPEMEIIIAGMQVPPNLGTDYTKKFQELYPELAEENNIPLIPLILDEVGGRDEFMQPDQIHPNAEGHKVVAETIWEILYPILK